MKKNQSGNVIFYVLIAVALLAALSYTVSNSLRGGGKSLGAERQALNASEIIEYGNVMAAAVSQTRLRGHADTEISFENSAVDGYKNNNCEEDECKIFNLSGGGVGYSAPKNEWLDEEMKMEPEYGAVYFSASTAIEGIGSDAQDLIMLIPYLTKDLCAAINKKLMIGAGMIPREVNGPAPMNKKFTGLFEDTSGGAKISGEAGASEASLIGKTAGCTESSGSGDNPPAGSFHYYQALIAR